MAYQECTLSPPASIHEDPAKGRSDELQLECVLSPPPSLHNEPIEPTADKSHAKPTVTFDLTPPEHATQHSKEDQKYQNPQQPQRVQPPSSWPEQVVPEEHPQEQPQSSSPADRPGSIGESIQSARLRARKSINKSTTFAKKQAYEFKDKLNNDDKTTPTDTSHAAAVTRPSHDGSRPDVKQATAPPVVDHGPEPTEKSPPTLRRRIKDAHDQRRERRANMSSSEKLRDAAEGLLIGCGIGAIIAIVCVPFGLI